MKHLRKIKIFKVKSFAYTPFENLEDIKFFKEQGIEFVATPQEADILISQNIKHLKKFFLRFGRRKTYLIWTLEPRFNIYFSECQKLFLGFIKCHIMNIYTGDVFVHIPTFHFKYCRHKISYIPDSFQLKNRRTVALMSFYKGLNAPPLIRNGESIDLIKIRSEIALEGFNRGVLDIIGKGWPNGLSLEDSREGNWPGRKLQILKDYQFNLCLENTIAENYVTEKIWDSIRASCLPIYYGKGTGIYQLFPKNSFIDVSDFEDYNELFEFIENMSDENYILRLNKCIEVYNNICDYTTNEISKIHQTMLKKIVEKCRTLVPFK